LERAKESFRKALKYAFIGSTATGVFALIFAEGIIGVFTTDPVVTQYALSYIWTVALTYGFLAAGLVEASAFQAIGKSWPGFWIFLFRFGVVSVPLAYVFTQVLGYPIESVWAAIVIGNLLSSAIGYVWITRTLSTLDLSKEPVHPMAGGP